MILRSMGAIALVAFMVLSGCSSKPAAKAGAAASDVVNPTFGDDTGAVHGLIVNEEKIPLAGVSIGLKNDRLTETTTNGGGEFGFSQVQPGDYVVVASGLGYAAGSQTITVAAGSVTSVEMTLVAQSIPGRPYTKVIGPLPGKFFCAFYAGLTGPCKGISFGFDDAAWAQASGNENNIWVLPQIFPGNKTNPMDTATGAVVEVDWTATTAAARWLFVSIEKLQCDSTGANCGRQDISPPTYADASGSGPLKAVAIPGKKTTGSVQMPANVTGFNIGVFPSGDPGGPQAPETPVTNPFPATPSAYTEQRFDVWITVFFNGEPAADYTALAL